MRLHIYFNVSEKLSYRRFNIFIIFFLITILLIYLTKSFSFKDTRFVLPFGLIKWEHSHKVIEEDININIVDSIEFECKSKSIGLLIFPILITPIVIRKMLYKTYNWQSR